MGILKKLNYIIDPDVFSVSEEYYDNYPHDAAYLMGDGKIKMLERKNGRVYFKKIRP